MLQQIIYEDLLHYVWKTRQLDLNDLATTEGLSVEVISWGTHNHDSGPDFFNAKIKIDGTLWVGNVEMHILSGDWERHSHDCDPAYDNVVLHVVYEEDQLVYNHEEQRIPCIEIKDRIPKHLLSNYRSLLQNSYKVPCEKNIHKVDDLTVNMWKSRLIAERLERKAADAKALLSDSKYDWETVFYIILTKYMGARVNTEPCEVLACNLPLLTIHKNKDNLQRLEALVFGVGGMLDATFDDEYHKALKAEWKFLKGKYDLSNVPPVMWKFSKMRPPNFPTVRLAQLVKILQQSTALFSKILETEDLKELRKLFSVTASEYWDTHYRFGKVSKDTVEKKLSSTFIDLLLINVVAPVIFLYGQEKADTDYTSRAIAILDGIKAEKNSTIKYWKDIGINVATALDSQALLHLKNEYCTHKRCLSCNIGNKIVGI